MRFLSRFLFSLVATSQAHLSRSLARESPPVPPSLCWNWGAVAGAPHTLLVLVWFLPCTRISSSAGVCVCVSSHSSLYKEESLFCFFSFFFSPSCFFFFTGGEDLLSLCCVFLSQREREREREFRVCLFVCFDGFRRVRKDPSGGR